MVRKYITHKNKKIEVLIDKEDVDLFNQHTWYYNNGYCRCDNPTGGGSGKSRLYLHRLVMGAQKEVLVDHINGLKMDNRRSNLRICTAAENARNRSCLPSGITFIKARGLWCAQITFDYRHICLGYYKTSAEASASYKTASKILFKQFSPFNNNKEE